MDGKDSESLGDEGRAAKDAPLSGDDQKSSDDDSKVKETRITSSSLLSNSFSTSET
jgi:hypothetical protein